jgi:hypothetical protein
MPKIGKLTWNSGGSPAKIYIPRQRSTVRILMKDGVPCDETITVTVSSKTIGMRDMRRWSGGAIKNNGCF